MALSEQTVNRHNIKRAEVFKVNGLCDLDIAFAHPNFDGYGDAECILCGKTNLKWMFSIRFDAPDALTALGKISTGIGRTEEVKLAVVGSKCVTDWLDAVPESVAKLEALKRWESEMRKANSAKAKKAVESKLKSYGYADQEALSDVLYAVVDLAKNSNVILSWFLHKKLRHYARSAQYNRIRSASTVKKAQDYLVEAQTAISDKTNATALVAPAPVAVTVETVEATPHSDLENLTDEARGLVAKARDLWKSGAAEANLTADNRDALIDIATKVKKFGKFASNRQERFFKFLISKAEGETAEKKAAPVVVAETLPGDASFASVSGVEGARY